MPGYLESLMNPASMGLLNLGAGLLASSGPSPFPVSTGAALGRGLQQGMQGYLQAADSQSKRAFLDAQAQHLSLPPEPKTATDATGLLRYVNGPNQGQIVPGFGAQAQPKPTPVGQLIAERDALPEADPRRQIYEEAIKKATSMQPLVQNNIGQSGVDYGTPPKDMAWARDASGKVLLRPEPQSGLLRPVAVPVGGGAVERQAAKDAEVKAAADEQQRKYADVVVEDVGRATDLVKKSALPVTGIGSVASSVPGTSAHDLSNLLNTIKANVGFDRLQEMRKSSPTGGALGQVSERENTLMQSVLGALEQSQNKGQFLYNLKRVQDTYLDIVHGKGNRPGGDGGAPKKGAVVDGWEFIGGDPSNKMNWRKK